MYKKILIKNPGKECLWADNNPSGWINGNCNNQYQVITFEIGKDFLFEDIS